jgi:Flp pilus assembly protein TadG
MPKPASHRRHQDGQALVIFALSLVAIMATLGLVIDAGSVSAERRHVQNAADMAALAGANDYLSTHSTDAVTTMARSTAAQNGYTNGAGGITVTVTVSGNPRTYVQVDVSTPHRNSFAGIIGQASWTVTATASALTGVPNTAEGAGPFLFSIDAFNADGSPKYTTPTDFGQINGDIPTSPLDVAWTNYTPGNVDSSVVADIINGTDVVNITIDFGTYIGQSNSGYHDTLFGMVDTYLTDVIVPVPIVDHAGNFMGWASFHVVSATAGSAKVIRGYFESPYFNKKLTIKDCTPACHGTSGGFGSYTVRLTN